MRGPRQRSRVQPSPLKHNAQPDNSNTYDTSTQHRTSDHGRRRQRYLRPHNFYPSTRLVSDNRSYRLHGYATINVNEWIFTKLWTSKIWWLSSPAATSLPRDEANTDVMLLSPYLLDSTLDLCYH